MSEKLYTSNEYWGKNPSYHSEDSFFKSKNFIKILKKNRFDISEIKNIVDIGCGLGGILKEIEKSKFFSEKTKFFGFDINEKVIEEANRNKEKSLSFFCENFFNSKSLSEADLIICADVFEHIQDYVGFLKNLSSYSKYFLFNIPLDISVRSILSDNFIKYNFENVGHLHFFNENISKLILNYCNFEIIDTVYAKNFLNHSKKDSIKKAIGYLPAKFIDLISERFASKIVGGYSLVCLAKSKNKKYI